MNSCARNRKQHKVLGLDMDLKPKYQPKVSTLDSISFNELCHYLSVALRLIAPAGSMLTLLPPLLTCHVTTSIIHFLCAHERLYGSSKHLWLGADDEYVSTDENTEKPFVSRRALNRQHV